MRQIGGKIGEPLERFLEPAKHGVEGDDQFGEFAGHIVFGDALAQPAGLEIRPAARAMARTGSRPRRVTSRPTTAVSSAAASTASQKSRRNWSRKSV